MRKSTRLIGFILPTLAGLALTANASAAPCFTVAGTKVTVNDLFTGADKKPQVVDLEDMPSTSTVASRGSESHNLIFMGVKHDAGKKNVTAFSAKIDSKDYAFPKDACAKK